MAMDVQSWIRDRHASYEVSPYYFVIDDGDGKVQAGFDVDVYGVSPEDDRLVPAPAREYAFGYAVLWRLVAEVAHEAADSCSLEVMAFPGRMVLDSHGDGKAKAMLRITISHLGPLDQPAGAPERLALEQLKKRLDALGILRR